jgi:hypothetical protein
MKSNNLKSKSENFPRIDPKLVDHLETIYPPLEYSPDLSSEDFARQAAFRAGQQEVIKKLKAVMQRQKEELYG